MFSCEICDIFKNNYFEEHLPTDASINDRQQETLCRERKTNPIKQLLKITDTWIWLSYFTSVALLFNFIPLDYESMVVV